MTVYQLIVKIIVSVIGHKTVVSCSPKLEIHSQKYLETGEK